MTIHSLIALLAAVVFLGSAAYVATRDDARTKNAWLVPAALSLGFLLFSLYTVASEGALGFWPEHTRNFWANQIWLDLLLAVGVGWFLLVPQARSLGMRPLPWLALVASTGSIGLLAMLARLLYLRERADPRAR